jgi:uncharacterized protein YjiS (DUF1127 family)
MNTISNVRPMAPSLVGHSRSSGLLAALKRWWVAYMTWRIQQAAMLTLGSMSDRELKDIGLTRSDIAWVVRDGTARGRAFIRFY